MIETLLISELNTEIGNVYASFPKTRPNTPFTVMQKMDQEYRNQINMCTISFISYADKVYDAAARDEAVQNAVFNLIGSPQISRVELGGGSGSEDSSNNLWTYESIFNFTYYS